MDQRIISSTHLSNNQVIGFKWLMSFIK